MSEFLPKYVDKAQIKYSRGFNPMVFRTPPGPIEPLAKNSPYHIHYKFSNTQTIGLRINQFYFPGWKVILNGKVIDSKVIEENLDPSGLMSIIVEVGDNQIIEAYYDGPPHRRMRTAIVFILSGVLLVLLFRTKREENP